MERQETTWLQICRQMANPAGNMHLHSRVANYSLFASFAPWQMSITGENDS